MRKLVAAVVFVFIAIGGAGPVFGSSPDETNVPPY
jgi:hypothetical protein